MITNSLHRHPVAANVFERDFTTDAENCKWAFYITYVWTRCGWLYLAVVFDLYSRRVVGWAMPNRMTRELALNALSMALTHRPRPELLVHHSDRGSQYASDDHRRLLDEPTLPLFVDGMKGGVAPKHRSLPTAYYSPCIT